MSECPFCHATYHSTYPPIELSQRQRLIYDAVLMSGPKGVKKEELIHRVFGDNPPDSSSGMLRVHIFEINRKVQNIGHRIKGRRDLGYILTQAEFPHWK